MTRTLPRHALTLSWALWASAALATAPGAAEGTLPPEQAAPLSEASDEPGGPPELSPGAAEELEAAVRLLGRQPTGHAVSTPKLVEALDLLAASGETDHLPLLANLGLDPTSGLAGPARQAHSAIIERTRLERRRSFTLQSAVTTEEIAPSEAVPLSGPEALRSPTERALVAYAAAVVGGTRPEWGGMSAMELMSAALQAEDAGDSASAVSLHSVAASQGHHGARAALMAHGLDPDRVLLGMLFSPAPEVVHPAPESSLSHLGAQGQALALEVFSSRLQARQPVQRIEAIHGLSLLLRAENTTSRTRRAVRSQLESAAERGGELERAAVRWTLAEPVYWSPSLP